MFKQLFKLFFRQPSHPDKATYHKFEGRIVEVDRRGVRKDNTIWIKVSLSAAGTRYEKKDYMGSLVIFNMEDSK